MRVIFIGAGIAGLSAAIALRKVGIDSTVYERADAAREVGAGISLWANAFRALDQIDLGDAVRQRSVQMTRSEARSNNGRTILTVLDARAIEAQLGMREIVRMIHRVDLLAALRSRVPLETLRYAHDCVAIDALEGRARARFQNGHIDEADAVIGADGIRSVVRDAVLTPEPPRYSGYTCWRGVCRRPASIEPGYVSEWWGHGKRIGITTLPEDRVYWFAVQNAPANMPVPDNRTHLLQAFSDWSEPGPTLFRTTPADDILRHDIYDRPPVATWSKGTVGLIGDAAHPTTPNLGQGGCLAIEDAIVLAREFARSTDAALALRAFTLARSSRAAAIVRESWQFGRLAQAEGRIVCALRDAAVGWLTRRMSPASMLRHARFDVGPLLPAPAANT